MRNTDLHNQFSVQFDGMSPDSQQLDTIEINELTKEIVCNNEAGQDG